MWLSRFQSATPYIWNSPEPCQNISHQASKPLSFQAEMTQRLLSQSSSGAVAYRSCGFCVSHSHILQCLCSGFASADLPPTLKFKDSAAGLKKCQKVGWEDQVIFHNDHSYKAPVLGSTWFNELWPCKIEVLCYCRIADWTDFMWNDGILSFHTTKQSVSNATNLKHCRIDYYI